MRKGECKKRNPTEDVGEWTKRTKLLETWEKLQGVPRIDEHGMMVRKAPDPINEWCSQLNRTYLRNSGKKGVGKKLNVKPTTS